ncbi:apyrase-like [Hyposmocoma kahamanoa]|uniref:apyrase-like n=1 Tax=Hyposmocoma kahamanoa TaxID=1477025 RepID=UPI000E6D8B16|nr:apyrase-like [Hyposmocoma kahamanoa]
MEVTVFLFFAYLTGVHSFALPFEGLYGLDIIHYNDFHARFQETAVHYPTCRFNNGSCLGGFPRLYKEISTLLKEKPNALLLNAGDSFQGTYWYTLLKWNVTQEFMNLLPHDAHAVGNHEFDDGPEGLAPYLSHLKAPVLAANMDVSQVPELQGLFQDSIVVKRKGRKIGIIGLATPETTYLSSPGKVVFMDPGEATDREAKKLTEKGVDIIILLSHCGLKKDYELARDHGEYIDIIVGGHSHSLLSNEPAPSGESVAGPYPVFIETNKNSKHKVLVVQASAFTKYLGNLTVFFDYVGDYVKWEGGPIFLNRSIPEDEGIKAKLQPYAQLIHEAENIRIGESTTTLLADECVYGECPLGNLIVDTIQAVAKEKVKSNYDYITFIQSSNIKASIPQGTITKGVLFEIFPYYDRITTVELQGKYVLEALERSVKHAWALDPFKGPRVLQVSGLRVTYNITLPEDNRVVSAIVGDINSTTPLDIDAIYQVSLPAFLGDGGDGYTMFPLGRKNIQQIGRDQTILTAYLEKNSPITVKTDGRIRILY